MCFLSRSTFYGQFRDLRSGSRRFGNPLGLVLGLALLVVLAAPAVAGGGTWFKAAGGYSGMAMDDINNSTFKFYDESIDGFNFPDLNSGFSLSFHLGVDLNPKTALGFSWEHQYASVEGQDDDVQADLNVAANLFMIDAYWTPLKTDRFDAGLVAGLGVLFPHGSTKVSSGNVDYGHGEIRGDSAFTTEVMALIDYGLGARSALSITAGWRWASVGKVTLDTATVVKDDGSNLTLDYTGYVFKVGWKYYLSLGDG